jgi:predicted HTH domain antitoxin
MAMAKVHFEIPEDILYALNENVLDFTFQTRLFTALQLYKRHKLSLGKAAQLAGIKKEYFLMEMDKYEIPLIDYEPEELDEEMVRFAQ